MFLNRKKKLEAIKNNWTKPIKKYRNFDFIALLHETITSKQSNKEVIDDKTWRDLNFDDIFTIVDRTSTPVGQQYLYHLLHNYVNDKNILKQRIQLSEYFKSNSALRESIQLELAKLDETNAYFIAPLIFGELPSRPKYYFIFFILSFLAFISIP